MLLKISKDKFSNGVNIDRFKEDLVQADLTGVVESIDDKVTHLFINGDAALNNTVDIKTINDVVKAHDGTPDPDSALNNLTATTDPTINDDINAGYSKFSFWINTLTGKVLICTDPAAGAAVWKDITTDLDTGEINTGSNVGGEKEVFKGKVGLDFEHRTLKEGTNITLTQNANDIEIAAATPGEANTASNIGGEKKVFKQKTGVDLELRTLKEGTGIVITENTSDLTIKAPRYAVISFAVNGNPYLTKSLDGTYLALATFPFPGTTAFGTPSKMKILNKGAGSGSRDLKIQQVSGTPATIAEKTGLTNTTFTILDMGTLSSLPTTEQIFEIQAKSSASEDNHLAALILEYT